MHKIWHLEIYDQFGNVVASAAQLPNEPSTIHGDMVLLAESLPSLVSLNRFFTDPDAKGKAAYGIFREGMKNSYGTVLPTWEAIKSNPEKQQLVTIWQNIAKTSSEVDPTLN